MIPGTIEEWKKALKDSEPGVERAVCVYALLSFGLSVERSNGRIFSEIYWTGTSDEYRVKPVARPWNAEDARRHVGFAFRFAGQSPAVHIIMPSHCDGKPEWHSIGCEYARPIPGTDPATWDWQKCEVVE